MIKTYISALLVALLAAAQMAPAETESTGQAPSDAKSGMVSWLLEKGIEEYEAGKYDEAITMFDGVLAIDNHNAKAVAYKKRAANRISGKEGKKPGLHPGTGDRRHSGGLESGT